jgi:hypothetical protein
MRIFEDTPYKELPDLRLPQDTTIFIDNTPMDDEGTRRVLIYGKDDDEDYVYADVEGIQQMLGRPVPEEELYEGAELRASGPRGAGKAGTLAPEWEGRNAHRLRDNPLELAFACAFQKFCETPSGSLGPSNLERLLSPDPKTTPSATRDQQQVACTVIQWLGSPVGQHFVMDVMGRAK